VQTELPNLQNYLPNWTVGGGYLMGDKKPTIPRYLRKVLKELKGKQFPGGEVSDAHIYHELGCTFLRGGEYDCDPEVVVDYPGKN
jgi:hypothetical protein